MASKGKKLEEIAYIRRLKESTIEDHIAELALFVPSFSIDAYVSPKQQEKIISAFEGLRTNKLKVIKEEVKDDVTYFQIRLVLAKHFT
ncbi:helix-turn-helix domain-containing protein [Priestia megaterium]